MSLKNDFVNYLGMCLEGGLVIDEQNKAPLGAIFKTLEMEKLGVLVSGPTGSGKSMIFEALNRIIHPKDSKKFRIVRAVDIVQDFNSSGYDIFEEYRKKENLVIDDIGMEDEGKYFGSTCNVIADLIASRYEVFKTSQCKTHFTTNLTVFEIKNKYGDRVMSRLGEMCDVITLISADRRAYRNFKKWVPVEHKQVYTDADLEWFARYEEARKKRMAMTEEDLEKERKANLRNFLLGENRAFIEWKEKAMEQTNQTELQPITTENQ